MAVVRFAFGTADTNANDGDVDDTAFVSLACTVPFRCLECGRIDGIADVVLSITVRFALAIDDTLLTKYLLTC